MTGVSFGLLARGVAVAAAMVSSTQASPKSDPACVVPPTPSTRAERGKRLRTSRLPGPSRLTAAPHGVWVRSVKYGPKSDR